MTKAQAKRKLKQVARLNGRPVRDFKVVRVIYLNGKRGYEISTRDRR